jgi:hypothetical protein
VTKVEANRACRAGLLAEAGDPGTEDHDRGIIVAVNRDHALVSWASGVCTPCPVADLRLVED